MARGPAATGLARGAAATGLVRGAAATGLVRGAAAAGLLLPPGLNPPAVSCGFLNTNPGPLGEDAVGGFNMSLAAARAGFVEDAVVLVALMNGRVIVGDMVILVVGPVIRVVVVGDANVVGLPVMRVVTVPGLVLMVPGAVMRVMGPVIRVVVAVPALRKVWVIGRGPGGARRRAPGGGARRRAPDTEMDGLKVWVMIGVLGGGAGRPRLSRCAITVAAAICGMVDW